jgi:hypothetical protein
VSHEVLSRDAQFNGLVAGSGFFFQPWDAVWVRPGSREKDGSNSRMRSFSSVGKPATSYPNLQQVPSKLRRIRHGNRESLKRVKLYRAGCRKSVGGELSPTAKKRGRMR